MIASFVITFREALEAALIIGILAAYLKKVDRSDLNKYLYIGTGTALLASLIVAVLFTTIYGGLEGRAAKIFEGLATLSAAAVLTYMIFWMTKHSQELKGELYEKMDTAISKGEVYGIVTVAFLSVFREGVETVLFLGATAISSPGDTLLGALLGIGVVLAITYFMFEGIYLLDIKKFFKYTSIVLLVFAAGLTAYGVHELNEAALIPSVVEHVWDINPPLNPDGSYPALHEKGSIGLILKSLVGYNGNPSLTEVLAYLGYWLTVGYYVLSGGQRSAKADAGKKGSSGVVKY
ncbi:ferrous iron permease EfeU [archaeon BMS3Abin16]|nr:ferrous iron permease EfeU [archaeon BMS3Abin16]